MFKRGHNRRTDQTFPKCLNIDGWNFARILYVALILGTCPFLPLPFLIPITPLSNHCRAIPSHSSPAFLSFPVIFGQYFTHMYPSAAAIASC